MLFTPHFTVFNKIFVDFFFSVQFSHKPVKLEGDYLLQGTDEKMAQGA